MWFLVFGYFQGTGKIRARPPGRRGGGPDDDKPMGQHAPARISQATRGIRIRIQIVGRSAESDGHVRPVRVQSEYESRAYVSQLGSIGSQLDRQIIRIGSTGVGVRAALSMALPRPGRASPRPLALPRLISLTAPPAPAPTSIDFLQMMTAADVVVSFASSLLLHNEDRRHFGWRVGCDRRLRIRRWRCPRQLDLPDWDQ
jgi:hypothetical protein